MAVKQFYYMIHQLNVPDSFRVGKLDEDMNPLASYTVSLKAQSRWACNCPAYMRKCKHLSYVQKFVDAGMPPNTVLNSISGEFEESLLDI